MEWNGCESGGEEANYREDDNMVSVVSYPKRCREWGDFSFRGNCDGRLFLNLVLRYHAKSVADPMLGSGTTRDVVNGLNRVRKAGIRYWGSDLREGFDLGSDALPGEFDLVWIHPPYWNMIPYSNDQRDLSTCASYGEFVERLGACLQRCMRAVMPGGNLAVLVGDMRKQGVYYPISRDVMNMERKLGPIRSVIIKVQHNCTSDRTRYTHLQEPPIKHEHCIVFHKAVK